MLVKLLMCIGGLGTALPYKQEYLELRLIQRNITRINYFILLVIYGDFWRSQYSAGFWYWCQHNFSVSGNKKFHSAQYFLVHRFIASQMVSIENCNSRGVVYRYTHCRPFTDFRDVYPKILLARLFSTSERQTRFQNTYDYYSRHQLLHDYDQ